MSIRIKIEESYKVAIKEKDMNRVNTLRLIKSAIKDKEIADRSNNTNQDITDADILSLLQNLIKQRKDSIESFKSAGRTDLVSKEQSEIEIINFYLPDQKDEKEIIEIVQQIITKNNLSSIKDMGKLMGIIKSKYSGQVDMGLVGKIAKSKFSN